MQRYEHGGAHEVGGLPDWSINTNPLGMPPAVKAALLENADAFARYPDPACASLCAAIAERWGLPAENVLCGNGAADLIFRICAWKRPKAVLVTAPTFSEYERPARLFGGRMIEHPLAAENGFLLTESFLDTLARERPEAVFLCNPNNPTGRLVPDALLREIARACAAQGALLVVDECFLPFTDAPSLADELPQNGGLLVLRAFTKLYSMAGLRLGYLLGNAATLRQIAPYGAQWSVSVPAQVCGLAALSSEPAWSEATRRLVREQREFLFAGLAALGLTVFPSEANFLLVRSEKPLHAPLLSRGIAVRDCSNFTGLDKRYIRVGIKTQAENDLLLGALREVL